VKLVTWNIWDGGEGRLDAIERVLREQNADVVALQEANDRGAVEMLAARLGMNLVYGEANSAYAVAWLSRSPVARSRNHRLPVLDKTLLEVEIEGACLFATHLSAGRKVVDEPHRIDETEAVLGETDPRAHVLVGDFNAAHPDDAIGTPPPEEHLDHVSRRPIELVLEAGFVDCYRELHPRECGWTYLSWHLWARLDYVFASRRLAVQRCELVPGAGDASDHLPVVAELTSRT
jgi:exodeoxyribonuclease III